METAPEAETITAFDQAVAAASVDQAGSALAKAHARQISETEAQKLYDQLTDDERLGLLDGDTPFWEGMASMRAEGYNAHPIVHGAVDRLGIPGTRFVDGPRGCVAGKGTAFPVSMARAASWDLDLEEEVGEVIGREIRAQGGNFFGGVCINLPRHPAWGRAQETYGDDPYHLGEFGAALTRGTQKYVMACAKHYALNSMENARFSVNVTIDDAALHDVYLPHFKRVVDEDVAAIMASYNSVNGEWAGQSEPLLTTILRDQWDWPGITVTDFIWGMRDGGLALNAGMDLEEPFAQQRDMHLRDQLASGETSWEMVRRAGIRILATQIRSYATRNPEAIDASIMANEESRSLARTVAARSMVLLKNDEVAGAPILPLDPARIEKIAIIGRLATQTNMGDHGSSDVRPPQHSTPADGIAEAFPNATITVVSEDDPAKAAQAAKDSDIAIIIAGFDARDEGEYVGSETMTRQELLALFPPMPEGTEAAAAPEGEDPFAVVMVGTVEMGSEGLGGDRTSLNLRPIDEEIIHAVAAANPRTVVSLVAAGTILMEGWRDQVPGIVMMWYAGMEGGRALADVLTGAQNPAGRLPFVVPTSPEHFPAFDINATEVTYDRFHGQRLLDKLGVEPAYPHGFGLSYTTFAIAEATASGVKDGTVTVTAKVTNTGKVDGRHVVQVYGRRSTGNYAGELMLVGFASVEVVAGQTRTATVDVSLTPLAQWDPSTRRRALPESCDVTIEVGAHAHDPAAIAIALV